MSQFINSIASQDHNLQQVLESVINPWVRNYKKIESCIKQNQEIEDVFVYIFYNSSNLNSCEIQNDEDKKKLVRFSIFFGKSESLNILLKKYKNILSDKFVFYSLNLMIENKEYRTFYKKIIDEIKYNNHSVMSIEYKSYLWKTVGKVAKEVLDYLFSDAEEASSYVDQGSIKSGFQTSRGQRVININGSVLSNIVDRNERVKSYFKSMSQSLIKKDQQLDLNYLPGDDETVVFSQFSETESEQSSVRTYRSDLKQEKPILIQSQPKVDKDSVNYNFVPSVDSAYNWDFKPDLYSEKIKLS